MTNIKGNELVLLNNDTILPLGPIHTKDNEPGHSSRSLLMDWINQHDVLFAQLCVFVGAVILSTPVLIFWNYNPCK